MKNIFNHDTDGELCICFQPNRQNRYAFRPTAGSALRALLKRVKARPDPIHTLATR